MNKKGHHHLLHPNPAERTARPALILKPHKGEMIQGASSSDRTSWEPALAPILPMDLECVRGALVGAGLICPPGLLLGEAQICCWERLGERKDEGLGLRWLEVGNRA